MVHLIHGGTQVSLVPGRHIQDQRDPTATATPCILEITW